MSNTAINDEYFIVKNAGKRWFEKPKENVSTTKSLKQILKDKEYGCLFCGLLLNHIADRGSGETRNTCDYRHNGRNYLFTQKLETLQEMIEPERKLAESKHDKNETSVSVKKEDRYEYKMERLAHLEYFIQICYWKMIARYPTKELNDELKKYFRGKLY